MAMTGTVKFFNGERGYGFIKPDDGGRDVFVHITAVERAGLKDLTEGQRITFESISLRSNQMVMTGNGVLDFGAKKVRMTFSTGSPAWTRLPLVGELLNTAKNELLQIHVTGTLQEPKVSASSINTFTTTVDKVLRGDQKD